MNDTTLLADEPLGQKLIKKGFWAYFFTFMVAPVGYIIKVLVSNTMSVEDIGIFYSVLGLVMLISIYNDLGLTEALQYFLPKYWIEKKYDYYKTIIYLTWVVQFITGIGIGALLYFSADWLAIHHFHSISAVPVIKILAFYFVGVNLFQVLCSVFYAFQDTFSQGLIETIRMYGILGFTLFFWLSHTLTITNFSYIWILGLGIGILIALIIFFKKYGYTLNYGKLHIDKKVIRTQLKYAFWVFLGANVGSLLGQVDQQIVVNFLGAKQAGYYTIFFTLISAYTIIISPVLMLIFPIVTELISKEDKTKLSMMQTLFYKYFSVFALSIGGLFFVLGPFVSSIFFGTKFFYSGELLSYVAPFLVLNVLIAINYSFLAGLGKVRERVIILGWALLVNVLLNILCIYGLGLGLIGAVIALIGGWIILFWRTCVIINKYQTIHFDWKYFAKNALLIGLLAAGIWFIKERLFVLDDLMRYRNLLRLGLISLGYYIIIAGFNWKSITILLKEVKALRK